MMICKMINVLLNHTEPTLALKGNILKIQGFTQQW